MPVAAPEKKTETGLVRILVEAKISDDIIVQGQRPDESHYITAKTERLPNDADLIHISGQRAAYQNPSVRVLKVMNALTEDGRVYSGDSGLPSGAQSDEDQAETRSFLASVEINGGFDAVYRKCEEEMSRYKSSRR